MPFFYFPLDYYRFDSCTTLMYKEQRNYENLQKRIFEGVGEYGIPQIYPENIEKENIDVISFSSLKASNSRKGKTCHFFIDDYRFNRLWTNIDRYIPMLQECEYVMTPDFSMYTDFPKAVQIYNHYRKHWCGAYMQEQGIKVIPTISWSDKDSFEWCFDGEPTHSTVAISSVGCMKSKEARQAFLDGYNEMIKRLSPEKIIFYGDIPDECKGNIVHISTFTDERFKEAITDGW